MIGVQKRLFYAKDRKMEKRIKKYLKYLDGLDRENLSKDELALIKDETARQIGFFQHERLIHLIVTVTFAVLTVISLFAAVFSDTVMPFIMTLLLFVLLVPYIRHYYILENSVQKMYVYYDKITKALYDDRGFIFDGSEERNG